MSPSFACRPVAALALLLVACSDSSPGPGGPLPLSRVLVSAPAPLSPAGAAATRGTTGDGTNVAYVSMPPGTDPSGVNVTVRNGPSGLPVGAPVADGGFDPIVIAAQPGDTLLITVDHANGAPAQGYAVVPVHSRPVVVRTSPPNRKTDVVLNTQVVVIFNQPMDSASLPGALLLRLGGGDVAGTVTVTWGGGAILRAAFAPASQLAPLTSYQFEVSTAALGQNGEPLEAPVQVEFTTGTEAAAVATVTITPSPLQRVVGGQQQLWALPVNAAGTALTMSCTWSTSNAAVADISSTGLLSALTVGTALIRATCGGVSGEATVTVVPVPSGLAFASVSTGADHTCGVTTSGAAYCWGDDTWGALGNSMTGGWDSLPSAVVGGLSFTMVDAGFGDSCGITPAGTTYCWGSGWLHTYGPVPEAAAAGFTFATVSIGGTHACGLTPAGAVYCWGVNGNGVLGIGKPLQGQSLTPAAVQGGLTFVQVSAGFYQTCGVTTGGAAYCWGLSPLLGNGTTTGPEQCLTFGGGGLPDCSTTPVAVAGGLTFRAVSAGEDHTCGVTAGGAAYCWGYNHVGYLGDGTTTPSFTPVAVAGGLTFATVSAGFYYTCGVTTSGAAYCWGDNTSGVLGNGTTTNSATPTAVGGGLTFTVLSTNTNAGGRQHTCGVTTGGVLYCWGQNAFGVLGDGTETSSTVPVKVAYQP